MPRHFSGSGGNDSWGFSPLCFWWTSGTLDPDSPRFPLGCDVRTWQQVWSPSGHTVFGNLVLAVGRGRPSRKTSTTRRTPQVSWHQPGSRADTTHVAPGFKAEPDGSDQRSLPGRTGRSRPAEKLPGFSPSRVSPKYPVKLPLGCSFLSNPSSLARLETRGNEPIRRLTTQQA